MREKMARAIYSISYGKSFTEEMWESMLKFYRDNPESANKWLILRQADAVLDALTHPTEEMILAGLSVQRTVGPLTEANEMRKTWQAMLRAAKDGQ